MTKVELVFDDSCPNVDKTRDRLRQVLRELGAAEEWIEWERSQEDAPSYVKAYGSPTVLVNEVDVEQSTSEGDSCRLYRNEEGKSEGVPSKNKIKKAIENAIKGHSPKKGRAAFFLTIPALAVSSFPLIFCPACWPTYAALLSSLGIGFFDYSPYLLPLVGVFLLTALVSLGFQARAQQNYKPFCLAMVSSIIIVTGKFLYPIEVVSTLGVVGLFASSVWSLFTKKAIEHSSCESCKTNK